jgi:type II secretory pathway component PulF
MHVGEISGALPEACQELQHQFETDQRVAWHMLILKTYLLINLLPCVFVPSFPGMLKHIDQKATIGWEALKPGLAWYGQHVLHAIVPWLAAAFAVWLVGKVVLALPGATGFRDRLSLSLPVISGGSKRTIKARFTRTLELLTKAAVPPDQALKEAALATGNSVVAARLAGAAAPLKQGGRMADAFRRTGVFNPSEVSLLATAEQTGTVEGALSQLASKARQERGDFLNLASRGGCMGGLIVSAICVVFAAAAGWLTFYRTIFAIFESPDWQP